MLFNSEEVVELFWVELDAIQLVRRYSACQCSISEELPLVESGQLGGERVVAAQVASKQSV